MIRLRSSKCKDLRWQWRWHRWWRWQWWWKYWSWWPRLAPLDSASPSVNKLLARVRIIWFLSIISHQRRSSSLSWWRRWRWSARMQRTEHGGREGKSGDQRSTLPRFFLHLLHFNWSILWIGSAFLGYQNFSLSHLHRNTSHHTTITRIFRESKPFLSQHIKYTYSYTVKQTWSTKV